jgi:tetratricopeptide (TPR) repeat protein
MGWTYFFIGEYEKALKWAKKSLFLDPTGPISYVETGTIYMGLGNDMMAEDLFNKALQLQGDFIFAYRNLITLNFSHGKNEEAIKYSQKALSLRPDAISTNSWAGDAELRAGNYKNAEQYYGKVLNIISGKSTLFRPNYTRAYLAYIYFKTGREEEAKELFSQFIDMANDELERGNERPLIPYTVAAIHAILDNKSEAYVWLQKAIDRGWRAYRLTARDPIFENLHGEEKFRQMMADIKRTVETMRQNVETMED